MSETPTEPLRCSVGYCGKEEDVRLIEDRIRWGAAVRRGWGTGYSGRPYAACKKCRRLLKTRHHRVWKYHQP